MFFLPFAVTNLLLNKRNMDINISMLISHTIFYYYISAILYKCCYFLTFCHIKIIDWCMKFNVFIKNCCYQFNFQWNATQNLKWKIMNSWSISTIVEIFAFWWMHIYTIGSIIFSAELRRLQTSLSINFYQLKNW